MRPAATGDPLDVLIVDDDQPIRELLRRFLEPEGYRVTDTDSAEAAAEIVERIGPAVAFCDVHMPSANGLWLADQIRDLSPATAIILATGDSRLPPAETLRSGIVAYVLKPLSRQRVVAATADAVRWSLAERRRSVLRRAGRLLPEA